MLLRLILILKRKGKGIFNYINTYRCVHARLKGKEVKPIPHWIMYASCILLFILIIAGLTRLNVYISN